MAQYTLGFIGFGNMGGAVAYGVMESATLKNKFSIAAYDITENSREKLETAGGCWHTTPTSLAENSDLVLLAVKPYQVRDVLKAVHPALNAGKTLLSIAAGQPLSALREALGGVCAAVQIMPNTPALVNDGVFGICFDDPLLSRERKEIVRTLFEELGTVFALPESKMNAFSAVAGCGPAYVYQMMDAVMEAAVTLGFTRKEASDMVVGLFRGSARMVGETGLHPAVLHSQVTSPGGMTIVGTNHLARAAVRGHIMDAVFAAYARGREMKKE